MQMLQLSQLTDLFQYLDIYGKSMSLKFQKRSKFKTTFGGIVTCVISVITAFWMYVTIDQMSHSSVASATLSHIHLTSLPRTLDLSPTSSETSIQFGLFNTTTKEPIDSELFSFKSKPYLNCQKSSLTTLTDSSLTEYLETTQATSASSLSIVSGLQIIACDESLSSYFNQTGFFCFDSAKFPKLFQTNTCKISLSIGIEESAELLTHPLRKSIINAIELRILIPDNDVDMRDVSDTFQRTTLEHLVLPLSSSKNLTTRVDILFEELESMDIKDFYQSDTEPIKAFKITSIMNQVTQPNFSIFSFDFYLI